MVIKQELLTLSIAELKALGPYLWLFGGGCLAIIVCGLRWLNPKWPVLVITLGSLLMAAISTLASMSEPTVTLFNSMLVSDRFTGFFNLIFLGTAFLTALSSVKYLDKEHLQYPEFNILLMFSALGMGIMAAALDLIVIFISLEIMSLAVYVLVGFRRADRKSNEASVKYFILGSLASAVFLYGCALVYGATNSLNVREIMSLLTTSKQLTQSGIFILGSTLLVIGFLFKVAAVPFHMWMPDVYEGAPTPITGFMTTGLKAAAFATFVRIVASTSAQQYLHEILWVSAVATLVVGNFIALTQTNLKRMLAFSSISHTGYLMIGLITGAYPAISMYLVGYALMNLGAFAVLSLLGGREDRGVNLTDLAGLSQKRPFLSFALTVFLFSMAGIPPTIGFSAKYMLLSSAVQAGEVWLVVIAVLCSAVSVYYYLRVIVQMYMKDPQGAQAPFVPSMLGTFVVAVTMLATLHFGLLPERMVEAARRTSVTSQQ